MQIGSELPQTLMDVGQLVFWTVASVGGVVAALTAVREVRETREQRERELRWRQIAAANELIDDLRAEARAQDAELMLD
jgi:hypothetical protein